MNDPRFQQQQPEAGRPLWPSGKSATAAKQPWLPAAQDAPRQKQKHLAWW